MFSEATRAAGSGSPLATTSQTYDMIGNTLTVTGPLGATQTIRYWRPPATPTTAWTA